MMKLNRNDITFKFIKGEDLVIADALRRTTVEDPDVRQRIMTICFDPDISDVRLEEIRKDTEEDPKFQNLIAYISTEWLEKKNLVENPVKQYYDLR